MKIGRYAPGKYSGVPHLASTTCFMTSLLDNNGLCELQQGLFTTDHDSTNAVPTPTAHNIRRTPSVTSRRSDPVSHGREMGRHNDQRSTNTDRPASDQATKQSEWWDDITDTQHKPHYRKKKKIGGAYTASQSYTAVAKKTSALDGKISLAIYFFFSSQRREPISLRAL